MMRMRALLACLLALLLCAAPVRAAQTAVLVYLCGADLESASGYASDDLYEMELAGLRADGDVALLVMAGGASEWYRAGLEGMDASVLSISQEGAQPVMGYPSRNMGEADALTEFLALGAELAPAEQVLLVLWGHGSGPLGVCYDELYDDSLTLEELKKALRDAQARGQRMDAVIFDACDMACADALFALEGLTDFVVFSQLSTLGGGGRYDRWLAGPAGSAREMCERFAQCYIETSRNGAFSERASVSAVDVAGAGRALDAIENFYAQIDALFVREPEAVLGIVRALAEDGAISDLSAVDALALAAAFEAEIPGAGAELREALAEAVILNETSAAEGEALCGLSLTLPGLDAELNRDLLETCLPRAGQSAYARAIVHLAAALEPLSRASGGLPEPDGEYEPEPELSQIWEGLPRSD